MGFKVDREAVATLVLPQLWAMSMGPCEIVLLYSSTILMQFCLSVECRTIPTLHACDQEAR
jgi:hypothetical protein